MQRSIATVSLSGTLPEKLEAIAAAGFDGVEIFENDLLYYDGSPREVKQMCADLGIAITLFQPFRDFEGCRRDRLARNLERAERTGDDLRGWRLRELHARSCAGQRRSGESRVSHYFHRSDWFSGSGKNRRAGAGYQESGPGRISRPGGDG